jgi:hypothetical protein
MPSILLAITRCRRSRRSPLRPSSAFYSAFHGAGRRKKKSKAPVIELECDVTTEDLKKAPDSRRRDPKVNGADLYVVRVTKSGCGSASPCGRCIKWCEWAGVRRVFHWDGVVGQWVMIKVNEQSTMGKSYTTNADIRVLDGTVSLTRFRFLFPSKPDSYFPSSRNFKWSSSHGAIINPSVQD